jgi:MFS family permease
VALIWLAVSLIGADAGYLAAGQCAAVLLFSVVGSQWADRWDHTRTMIAVDLLRAGIVFIPVILSGSIPLSLPLLWIVALSLAGLSAFFEPALQATMLQISPDGRMLKAATGLMGTTMRLARVLAPGVIVLLTPVIPMIHFFTVNALSFLVSALLVGSVRVPKSEPKEQRLIEKSRLSFVKNVSSGFYLAVKNTQFKWMLITKAFASGAWGLGYGLGLVLLVLEIAPHDVRAYGWVIAAYGFGNVGGSLVIGNMQRHRPARLMNLGFIWLGVGFVWMANCDSLAALGVASAFAAIGGPMNDVPFVDSVQRSFKLKEIPKIVRLRMAIETTAILLGMAIAPTLFKSFSAAMVIGLCGGVCVLAGAGGLLKLRGVAT